VTANIFIDLAPQDEPDNAMRWATASITWSSAPATWRNPAAARFSRIRKFTSTPPKACRTAHADRLHRRGVPTVFTAGQLQCPTGKNVNFTVALSDADTMPARQQAFVTPTTAAWQSGRMM